MNIEPDPNPQRLDAAVDHSQGSDSPTQDPAGAPPVPAPGVEAVAATRVAEPDALFTGSGIGKYRVLDRIRAGERAILLKARDVLLDRLVVIKQLAPALLDDPRACGRFRKEAYLLAQLADDGRHIVNVHELIEERRGLFIVTEHVPGPPLESLIARQRLTQQNSLELLARLCLGLRAVHRAGIIHRDLAPRHVLIDESGRPKIADFGLAAGEGADPDYSVLSPAYTAPEVLLHRPYDARVDIYSLGMIGYEMLVGRPAFKRLAAQRLGGEVDLVSAEAWRVLHSRAEEWPEPASVTPHVSAVLSSIVARMVRLEPDARFQTVEEIIAVLVRNFSRSPARPALTAQLHRGPAGPLSGEVPPAGTGVGAPKTPAWQDAWAAGTTSAAIAPQPDWTSVDPRAGGRPAFAEDGATSPAHTRTVSIGIRGRPDAVAGPTDWTEWRAPELPRRRVPPPMPVPIKRDGGGVGPTRSGRRRARLARRARRAVWMAVSAGLILGLSTPFAWYAWRSSSIPALLVVGRDAYERGDYLEAISAFEHTVHRRVHNSDLHAAQRQARGWLALTKARVALAASDIPTAERHVREALRQGLDRAIVQPVHLAVLRRQSEERLRGQFGDELLHDVAGIDGPGDDGASAAPQPDDTPAEGRDVHRPAEIPGPPGTAGASHSPAEGSDRGRTPGIDRGDERVYLSAVDAVRDALDQGLCADAQAALTRLEAIRRDNLYEELSYQAFMLCRRTNAIEQGDSLSAQAEYRAAVEQYRDAIRFGVTPELREKLARAVAQALMEEGREALKAGDVAAARHKFEAAEWRDPSSGARQAFERLLAEYRARPTSTPTTLRVADPPTGEPAAAGPSPRVRVRTWLRNLCAGFGRLVEWTAREVRSALERVAPTASESRVAPDGPGP